MRLIPAVFFALSASLLALTDLRAQAEPPHTELPRVASAMASERSQLPESVLRAERQTGGEVLRAERMQRDGRDVYRLKVLTPDGRVRIMREDPRERRRETWRDAHREPLTDQPAADPRPASEPRHAAPPGTLDRSETPPPIERGDHH